MNNVLRVDALCRLSAERISQIRKLEEACRKVDGESFELYLGTDMNYDRRIKAFFLCYKGAELAGVMELFIPSVKEAEATVYVHPDYRQTGVFGHLLAAAEAELDANGVKRLYLKAEPGKKAVKAVAKSIGAKLRYSELLMGLEPESGVNERHVPESGVNEKDVLESDVHLEIEAEQKAETDYDQGSTLSEEALVFEMYENELRVHSGDSEEPIRVFLSGSEQKRKPDVGDDEIPIALAYASVTGSFCYIFGVEVEKAHRGKGYGRKLMELLIGYLAENYPGRRLTLQVTTKNKPALNLYRSLGFVVDTQIDYYSRLTRLP